MDPCPQCDREVDDNTTNSARKYYCPSCDLHFDPETWCCPRCEDETNVTLNPRDNHYEYYCYVCGCAFNRLGPRFNPEQIEYGVLENGLNDFGKQLSLSVKKLETGLPQTFQFTLQNTGAKPVVVQGKTPIALQNLQLDGNWWTIVGNPDGYTPTEIQTLNPEDYTEWKVEIALNRTKGPGFESHRRLTGGDYRLIYWGIPDSTTVLAVKFGLSL